MAFVSKPQGMKSSQKKRKKDNVAASTQHEIALPQLLDPNMELPNKSRQAKSQKLKAQEEYVNIALSNKILREAQQQQFEVEKERNEHIQAGTIFSSIRTDTSSDEEDEDKDLFDSQSHLDEFEDIPEEEERILAMFMAERPIPQKTLADLILEKIHERDSVVSDTGGRPMPAVDEKVMAVYRGVGKILSRFTSGKVPKAFKILPCLTNWEEVLYLTEPESWTANAMYYATRIFASNLSSKMAQRFYCLVLLPRIRNDITDQKRLHFALYQALKKAVYKPAAFYKGILLPLCQSRTCSLREAVIIGSVVQKVSIPSLHSSVALLKIAEMEYCGTNSYFMKLLLDKKYALPYRVLDGVMSHFMRFLEDERTLPVIWHQCLLAFVQRYKNELRKEDKNKLERLMRHHKHYLVTPEIKRELQSSHNRGQHAPDIDMSEGAWPTVVVNGRIEEDIWNLPEVPLDMEE